MTATLTPNSETQIVDMVRAARAAGEPFEIVGGGTRKGLGGPVQAAGTLSLEKLGGVTLYEPGALSLMAKAGTPVAEIERVLAEQGQRLSFEPMDHRALFATTGEPTIGGVVAANVSGPRRIIAGACRDSLIGVRFVNGNGEIINNGGRVMKNVTGLDLVKLMAGSFGTLGVLSEVSFKVLPASERQATLVFDALGVKAAVGVLSGALGSPFEVTGAAHLPENTHAGQKPAMTLLRVEGFATQVDYRLDRLRQTIGAGLDSRVVEGKEHEALWRYVRDVEVFKGTGHQVWKLSVKPGDAPAIDKDLRARIKARTVFDWGGGLIWVGVENNKTAEAQTIRRVVGRYGGHATLVRAPDALRSAIAPFQPQARRIAEISTAMRNRFDPDGIFNPGRMNA